MSVQTQDPMIDDSAARWARHVMETENPDGVERVLREERRAYLELAFAAIPTRNAPKPDKTGQNATQRANMTGPS